MAARNGRCPQPPARQRRQRRGRQLPAQHGRFVFQPVFHALFPDPAAKQVVQRRFGAGRGWRGQIFLKPPMQPFRGGTAKRGIVQDAAQAVGRHQVPGHHFAERGGDVVLSLGKQPGRQRHAEAPDAPRTPRPEQHPDGQIIRHAADDRPDGHIQRKLYQRVHCPILSRRPAGPITEG